MGRTSSTTANWTIKIERTLCDLLVTGVTSGNSNKWKSSQSAESSRGKKIVKASELSNALFVIADVTKAKYETIKLEDEKFLMPKCIKHLHKIEGVISGRSRMLAIDKFAYVILGCLLDVCLIILFDVF
ncbi:hypothetical protein GIB67_031424 [Kingdonia uniflora]|uniref:Uncharacterized protein n=1 Tax=Kingdonia uniflora TaxID=39325 RepID=A0A7J7MB94_9MAGN|nr:hypothetical protein GIB67_031424 [Kingdonia uniflora]